MANLRFVYNQTNTTGWHDKPNNCHNHVTRWARTIGRRRRFEKNTAIFGKNAKNDLETPINNKIN